MVVGRHVVRVRICSCPKRDMNQELEQIESVQSNMPVRGKKRKIAGTAVPNVPRIKTEQYSPGCGMMVPVPVSLPYNNSGEFMMQSRFEPLNYMEVSFVWRC
jgi:P53 DNA-binding domain